MSDSLTISSQKPQNDAFDYDELRKAGISCLEKTGSAVWTDYNVHDPGITTLELLCYALTDLSYRANYTIPDLLATPTDTKANILKHFFSAANIFPNNAVTINDYRKLIIDIVGVKNAWLQKRTIGIFADISRKKLSFQQPVSPKWERVDISGCYDVLLEFDTNVADIDKGTIKNTVGDLLMANRNVCEDFLSVNEIDKQQFRLCCELELATSADPFDTLAQLFANIQLYLTPLIKFYRLNDLFNQGYTADVIFQGPLLVHGFIKDEELTGSDLKAEIHLSDVIQQILNVDGISNVLDIIFNPSDQVQELDNKWVIPVNNGKQPVVNVLDSNILIYKNGMPMRPDMSVVDSRFRKLMDDVIVGNDQVRTEDISFHTGTFIDAGNYYSIQNHFPKNYGISHWGLPEDATDYRIAQAKQLQGYLYFFDQHLANSFSQIAHLANLFSAGTESHTYFTQLVSSFKNADDLFVNKSTVEANLQGAAEDKTLYYKRRNLFLDHLLSRFSETFADYVNVLNSGFKANSKDVISPSVTSQDDIIADKVKFLNNYPEYSCKRFCGYNYQDTYQLWDTGNISGLEKRLESLLGFDNLNRRNLVNLLTEIKEDTNEANNKEYWFSISDYRNTKVLLEGAEKLASEEDATFALEDTLSLLYSPLNLKIVDNGSGGFAYQVVNADKILGVSVDVFTTAAAANTDLQLLVSLVTLTRADEGLFLIEHLLLFPPKDLGIPASPIEPPASPPNISSGFLPICVDDSCKDCEDKDPYSFRISIVLPAYAPRFLNMNFRQYCERTIRMEAPSHTFVKICWVSNEQLAEFELVFKDWLEVKSGKTADTNNIKLDRFTTILTALKSIYPVARLEDCSSTEERTLFMLNQNALGTLKT